MPSVYSLMSYGSRNNSLGDKFCAFVLAIAPLLQHYKGLVENAGFTVLLLVTPVLLLRTMNKIHFRRVNRVCLLAIIPLIIFFLYTIIVRDFNVMRLGYVLLISWILICIAIGCINVPYFFKCAVWVALLATVAIFIQSFFHLLGRTIDFRPLSLLVSQDVIWVRNSVSFGTAGFLFRPSGFFLEPSHFFLYTFPIITVLLLSSENNKNSLKIAFFLTMGIILSTSGMGIAVAFGVWLLYLSVYKNANNDRININKFFNVKNVIIFFLFVVVLFLAYKFVPFFHSSIDRILTDNETSNAIDGRVRLAKMFVRDISGLAIWFGSSGVGDLDFNLSGFFATFIKFGIFGLLFSYLFYIQGFFKLKGPYFWLTLIIVVISYFTAHTHGTFYMLYFVLFLMNGYYESSHSIR